MSTLANTDIMFQTATYWGPSTPDGYGGGTFPAPVEITCRWEDKPELFIDSDGREAQSSSIVYPDQVVENEGWLFLGSSVASDPHDVSGAREIRAVRKIPSLDDVWHELKVWL